MYFVFTIELIYIVKSYRLVAYYTVSLIQPPLGTFTNISTQARWRLQDNEAVAAVAAYIRELTE